MVEEGPNVGSAPLNNSDYYEDIDNPDKNNSKRGAARDNDDVGKYYSILPIRDLTVAERWKYRTRRWTFYFMFSFFIVLVLFFPFTINDLGTWFWVVHILYVDLDVTVTKNQNFIRFLHGPSFIGSFIIAAVGTLILVREPSYIHTRAGENQRQVYQLWIIHSVTNFIPPFLHALDVYHNVIHLRKRHDITPPCTKFPKGTSHSTPLRQLLRVIILFLSPVAIVVGWFCLKFHPEYDILHDFPIAIYLPALLVIDILAGILLIACLISSVHNKKYPPLLGNN